MSCGIGCRCGSDPTLLWLWCRPAAAAPIQPLAWKLPYPLGVALKKKKEEGSQWAGTEGVLWFGVGKVGKGHIVLRNLFIPSTISM